MSQHHDIFSFTPSSFFHSLHHHIQGSLRIFIFFINSLTIFFSLPFSKTTQRTQSLQTNHSNIILYMMTIFSLYFPHLLSLLHTFINSFKNHIHSFMFLATAINTATHNYYKCHPPVSPTTHVNDVSPPSPAVHDIDIDGFTCCTESLGFESIDERRDREIHHDNNNSNDGDCCSWRRMRVAGGTRHWREVKSFPPPLSSLNRSGQPSFFLLPVRKNGRLKLTKVRVKRPDILYASRQEGRLRLYLVPDTVDDVEEQEYQDEEEEELVEEVEEEAIMLESQAEEEEEVVEEIRDEKEEDRVGEWKFPMGGNEGFRRCHQMVNQCYGSHENLHMYGLGIA